MRTIRVLLVVVASGLMGSAVVGCRSAWPARAPHYEPYYGTASAPIEPIPAPAPAPIAGGSGGAGGSCQHCQ